MSLFQTMVERDRRFAEALLFMGLLAIAANRSVTLTVAGCLMFGLGLLLRLVT